MSKSAMETYQNKENYLKEAIKKIYETQEFSDVTFTVGKKIFKVHKLILASRCTEFKRLLLEPNSVQDIIVEDDSVTEIGFEILLRFIYTDTLGTDDKQSIVKAYQAAHFYNQKKLMGMCEVLMHSWSITVDEVCELLNVSLKITTFEEKCLQFIKKNALKVIESPTFFKLNHEAMNCILNNEVLNSVGVKKRIIKIVEWGAKQQKDPSNYAAVRDYFLQRGLLGKLKIEELNLNEITELFIGTYKALLTPDETLKFIEYYQVKDKSVLPDWCLLH